MKIGKSEELNSLRKIFANKIDFIIRKPKVIKQIKDYNNIYISFNLLLRAFYSSITLYSIFGFILSFFIT